MPWKTLPIGLLLTLVSSPGIAQDAPQAAPKPAPAAASDPAPVFAAFPATTKVAFVDPDLLLTTTAEGKRVSASVQAFRAKKLSELAEKNQRLEAMRTRRQQSGALLSASALEALDKDISRLGVEIQRATQDADAEFNERVGQLQAEFRKKLQPVLSSVLKARDVHALLTPSVGLGWVDPAIDLTEAVAREMDKTYPAEPAAPKTK